jgi:hypothetical protein
MSHEPAVSVSRLRAEGVIKPDSTEVDVAFTQGDEVHIVRDIRVAHRIFPNGGSWSFFVCECGRRARTLRLVDGRALCRWCSGVSNTDAVRVADRIERLKAKLYGPPARLKPRPGRTMDRRQETEAALRRALIVERRERLKDAAP